MCFSKVKGLFEAKKHPTKCLLFIIKSRFRRAKYFYLLGFSLNMGSGAKKYKSDLLRKNLFSYDLGDLRSSIDLVYFDDFKTHH